MLRNFMFIMEPSPRSATLPRRLGEVSAGHHSLDSWKSQSLADVDGFDASVGVGAPQDSRIQKPRQIDVRSVAGPASYLVGAVVAHRTCPDDFEVLHLRFSSHVVSYLHRRISAILPYRVSVRPAVVHAGAQ